MSLRTIREKVVSAETSATSGTRTVKTVTHLGGRALDEFDELEIYIEATQNLAGSSPTLDMFYQKAIRPSPDPADADDWTDYATHTQFGGGANNIIRLPHSMSSGVPHVASMTRNKENEVQVAGSIVTGHWGDRLRIREKMGGTVTTPMIYNIYMTGILRTSE